MFMDKLFWWFNREHTVRETAKSVCWVAFAALLLIACSFGMALQKHMDHVAAETLALMRTTSHEVAGLAQTREQIRRTMLVADQTLATASGTIASARVPISAAAETVKLVNQPCLVRLEGGEKAVCGTLADLNRTLATARGTMGQAEVALHHEAANLDRLDDQEQLLFRDVHATLANLQIDAADAHVLLSDPAIPLLLGKATSTSTTFDHMLATADQVETKATAGYLHPSKNPLVRTWRYVSPFLLPAATVAAATR